MPIANLINSTATIDSFRAARPGYGKPAITHVLTEFGERSREFSTRQALLDLGFSSSGAVVSQFDAMTTQEERRPRTVVVGRRDTPVAQTWNFSFTGTADGPYTIPINGVDHTFTASGSTEDEIRDGIIAAINGGTEPVTGGTPTASAFVLVADNAGQPFVIGELVSPGDALSGTEAAANHGIYDDFQAISQHNRTIYGWSTSSRTTPDLLEASRWMEGAIGIFFGQSDDADILDPAETGDTASQLLALQRTRTLLCYKSNDLHTFAEAWMGRMLPSAAGSENWAWQPINGVLPDTLTESEVDAIQAKRANWIENIGGRNQSFLGMTSAPGIWVDLVRGRDKVVSDITAAKIDLLSSTPKLDFDELPILAGRIASAINSNSRFVVTSETRVRLPDVVPSQDISNREVQGITWTTRLRVPVNKVTSSGVLTIGTADLVIGGEA